MTTGIGILSSAYYLPSETAGVSEIFGREAIPQERLVADIDFQLDIGIERVHLAGEASAASLGLAASRQAMEKASIGADELDLIVDFTSVPEEHPAPTWSAAGLIQKELGAQLAWATAVNTGGCASYHVALKTTCALMAADPKLNTALLFAGDKVPPFNHTYYPITVICDGGSALILRKGYSRRVILAVEVATVGKLHDIWYVPGFHNRDEERVPDMSWLHMTCNVPKFNKEVIPINLFMFRRVMRAAMKQAGLKSSEIDYTIYPTFSSWDQESFCRGMRIDPEKIYTAGLARHGHLQETDMVLNFVDAEEAGIMAPGDKIMVTGNGAGFTWGAAIIEY